MGEGKEQNRKYRPFFIVLLSFHKDNSVSLLPGNSEGKQVVIFYIFRGGNRDAREAKGPL